MEPASPALAGRFVSTAAREIQSIEADQRPEQKFRQAFTGAPAIAGSRENKQQIPLPAPRGGWAGSFYGVRIGVKPGTMLSARGMHSTLLLLPMVFFAPTLQKWQLGVLVFFFFLVISCLLYRICPNFTHTQLFLVPYSFFVFYCLSRCLSRCKHCHKGSQMPAFLNTAQDSH